MNIRNLTRTIYNGFYSVIEVLVWIGYLALAGIVLVTLIDGTGRYLFNRPLQGSYAFVLLGMLILGGFAITYTAVKKGHVAIDLLVARFSRRAQIVIESIASLLGFGTWALLAYQVYLGSLLPDTTEDLRIPRGPFLFTLAVTIFLCCLTLLIQAFHPEVVEEKPGEKKEEV